MKRYLLLILCLSNVFDCLYSQVPKTYEIEEIRDILYVPSNNIQNDSLQRLNLVLPKNGEQVPLFIWIGGGAWSYVDRDMEMDMAEKFAKEGIAFASVGHRLSTATWKDPSLNQGIKHPEHIKDLAAAFNWLYRNASDYNYDTANIFVGGYSSGAHLAALLSMDDKYLNQYGLSKSIIKGVVPIAGAYDISNYHDAFANGTRKELADLHVKAVFGSTENHFYEASPTSYVKSMSVPMLLISETGSYNYTRIFEDKINDTGFDALEVIHVREMGHAALWKNLSYEKDSKYRARIINSIKNGNKEPQ